MPAEAQEIVCPECSALLRIPPSQQGIESVSCPDCQLELQIVADEQGTISLLKQTFPDSVPVTNNSKTPLYVVGAVVLLLVFGFFINPLLQTDSGDDVAVHQDQQQDDLAEQSQEQNSDAAMDEDQQPVVKVNELTVHDILSQRGKEILSQANQNGQYPAAFASQNPEEVDAPLSWLAALNFPSDSSAVVDWNRNWNDPFNDHFVRQQRPDLLNPSLKTVVSPDRYPATHMVGIAGVGPDAAQLPADHPRAGIFGDNRITTTKDIKDGLSNTWMVAGVTRQLPAWANGKKSIRPVTAEPYVNGPDGFGTGQNDRMLILLADGSVREMSTSTEGTIFRRLAAMADGLPLDATVAGEPGIQEKETPLSPVTPENPPPKEVTMKDPKVAEAAANEEKIKAFQQKANRQLKRRLIAFELNEPTPLNEILVEIEAILDLPIRFDDIAIPAEDPLRTEKATLVAKSITMEKLLSQLLTPLKLQYTIETDHLSIKLLK